MDISEIRFGQLYFNEKGKVEVFEMRPIQVDYINEWKPIPLTDEWLLKFGFENKGIYGFHKLITETSIEDDGASIWFFKGKMYIAGPDAPNEHYCILVKCEYIHQLQNLYWCLTGNELELKP